MKAHLGDTPSQQLSHIELKVSHLQVVLSVVTWSPVSTFCERKSTPQTHSYRDSLQWHVSVLCAAHLSECTVEKAVVLALLDSCLWRCVSAWKYKWVKWLKEADCGNYTHGLRRNTIYIHAGKCFFTLLWCVLLLILTLLRSFSLQLECFLPPTHFLTSLSVSFVFCHMCFCLSFCSRCRGSVGAGHVCF